MAKFKVGDKVTVDGQAGEITEVAVHDTAYLKSGLDQLYTVKLTAWEKCEVKDVVKFKGPEGELRDHECDTLGAVPESSLKGAGHHHGAVRTGR